MFFIKVIKNKLLCYNLLMISLHIKEIAGRHSNRIRSSRICSAFCRSFIYLFIELYLFILFFCVLDFTPVITTQIGKKTGISVSTVCCVCFLSMSCLENGPSQLSVVLSFSSTSSVESSYWSASVWTAAYPLSMTKCCSRPRSPSSL